VKIVQETIVRCMAIRKRELAKSLTKRVNPEDHKEILLITQIIEEIANGTIEIKTK